MKITVFVLLLFVSLSITAKPGSDTKFISQEMIDTSILRAFVILNASADMAGVGFGHKKSLNEAKKIAQDLKARAKGDPNERYVLWKVSELEAQIYLEEQDLILQQMQKRQLTINELVSKYNAEVGKWRPDFATLYRIHKNMDQVDPGKAGELADSYNKRKNALSREVVYFLEKALLAGNADSARKELGYLLRNQMYLNVSASAYKQLEDRVEGLYTAREKSPSIKTAAISAERLLDRMNIVEARKTLDSADNILTTIKKYLPQSEAASMSAVLKRSYRKLEAKEDSLVNVNLTMLRNEGIDAADRYLQTVLRPYGVSREKSASVDRMIISAKSPEEAHGPSAIAGLEDEGDDEVNPAMDDVMSAAMKKAQVKKDSLQAIENAMLWQEQQEQARRDSIEQVRHAAEEAALQRRQLRVDSLTMCIYNKIEKSDASGAEKLFQSESAFLQSNMRSEDFSMLKTTIDQFNSFAMDQKSTIAYLSPVEEKSAGIVQPTPVQSIGTVQSSPAATGSARVPVTSVAAVQQQPVSPVATPVTVTAKEQSSGVNKEKTNADRAQQEILGIYTLLEQNEIDRAYKRFQINKSPLRKYLEPEAYSMLEMTVVQAYQFYTTHK